MEKIIGIKELHRNLKNISEKALSGESFIVIKNSKPVFRIVPLENERPAKYTLQDFKKLQFKSSDKNLSQNIDSVIY